MKITFLGTGGAVPTASRDNTSFLVETVGQLFLFDSPGSLTRKILSTGYRPEELTAVFISHVHADHVYGLPALVHSLMLEAKTIPLVGSAETVEFCLRLLDLFGLRKEKIRFRLQPFPLESGKTVELFPEISVTGMAVPHHSSSLAFRLETPEGKIIYSGDTPVHQPLLEMAGGTGFLIHDCSTPARYFEVMPFLKTMHSHSLELGEAAEKSGIKFLIPCHFFSDLGFSVSEIEAEIRKNYSGRLFIPEDLSAVELKVQPEAEGRG
ncbi:MAG: MBL fold metallo-hydrolase [Candidatus Saccharicenans sp.]|nr:MBL fold metallo-hydrolase [Candidatus Saccharicenans sp.]